MEHRGSGTAAGLVRGAGLRVCGAIGADGEDAEPGAAAQCALSGAGGQDHRAAARGASDQRHAEDDRDPVAIPGVPVLSDDVSAGISEWGCFLPVRAAAEDRGKFATRWVAAEDFCAGKENVRRHSSLPGHLLFVWKCAVALLRE